MAAKTRPKVSCEGMPFSRSRKQRKKSVAEFGPTGDLDEVVAAGEGGAEAEDEDLVESVLEVGALAAWVGEGFQAINKVARLLGHGYSLRSFPNAALAPQHNSCII